MTRGPGCSYWEWYRQKKGMKCLNGELEVLKNVIHILYSMTVPLDMPVLLQADVLDGKLRRKGKKFMRKTFHTLPIIIISLILYRNSLKVEIQYTK